MTTRDLLPFAHDLSSSLDVALPGVLLGAYLHGSGALGGFVARKSDVDILFVARRGLTAEEKRVAADVLSNHGPCPGSGIETSIILEACAREPEAGAFEMHVTTGTDAKVVDGAGHKGDSDLVLHVQVCRAAGVALFGPPPSEVFGEVPRPLGLSRMRDELAWAMASASVEYAVLNACRALRFAREGVVCSKVEAGEWGLGAVPEFAAIIASAVRQQVGPSPATDRFIPPDQWSGATMVGESVREFIDVVVDELARGR